MQVAAGKLASKPSKTQVDQAIAALTAAFGNRVVTSQAVREQHGNTVTWIPNQPPDAVVYPQSTEDVQQAVRICAQHGMPIIAFGQGSSLEGHVNAPQGGVSIDFRDMNKVLAVHPEDLDCVVEPGITRKQLNEHIRDRGVFFPIDPGADASLGGMAATRCSGTNAVRYGTMRDNVMALKVVLPNGELMTTARRAKKSSAGYDLTRLMVGSEGTLGVITELTLKFAGIPEAISGGVCPFLRWRPVATPPSQRSRAAFRSRALSCSTRCRCERSIFIRSSDWPRRRCCSWNSTAPRRRSPNSQKDLARLPPSSAADRSNGPPSRRIAPSCGKRVTTPRCRTSRCGPAHR